MIDSIKYTPKQVAYKTGVGYRKILDDIKKGILKAKRDGGQSLIINQLDLIVYLESLKVEKEKELFISFQGKIPESKIIGITEEFVETFNKINDEYKVCLSLNIENE